MSATSKSPHPLRPGRFPRRLLAILAVTAAASSAALGPVSAAPLERVEEEVDVQPLAASVVRLLEALEFIGTPLPEGDREALAAALSQGDDGRALAGIQAVLDAHCLVGININPESRVKVVPGPAAPVLDEQGWRAFLVRVHNQAGVTAELRASSPNARKVAGSPPGDVRNRWMDLSLFTGRPLQKALSGVGLEYRILELYSRDAGKREGTLAFDVGQGTQDLGFRNQTSILFDCRPAREIELEVWDEKGAPTTATFEVRDCFGRVYPLQSKRIAPDFHFHPQIYRAHGEKLRLPDGAYTVKFYRGPESLPETREIEVGPGPGKLGFRVERWVDPAARGWWSGDHHIHAAGCAHYNSPTEGVHAPDMMRHCLGEDLKVGANLTWGPCFDYQKQFFTGKVDAVSQPPYLLRYDVEVSGFGSHQSGHLCLLRLKDQIYPGGDSKHHWPTLCLNTLRWAKAQGSVTGPAHSGWGLKVDTAELPNLVIPPYDGIGANEYIVDVTHEVPGPGGALVPAVDFISTVDTPYVWELNIWYHTLNCGFRTRISGETDFPCIYGERVGLGRSYVHVDGPLTYDAWCEGVRAGRCYVGDGRSHLMDFRAGGVEVGRAGSELRLEKPGEVVFEVSAAALLPEDPAPGRAIRSRHYSQKPYWHIERARIDDSCAVEVELVVNGEPKMTRRLEADGETRELRFPVQIEQSSWVALRILPSSHTNPIWVMVGDKPVRASRESAEWCLQGVDRCWSQKKRFIRQDEMADAESAYAHARETYRRIISEVPPARRE